MGNTILIIIIFILVIDFIFERFLDGLNAKKLSDTLPEELKDIYDSEAYQKSQRYFKAKQVFTHITGAVSMVLILVLLIFGGFGWLNSILETLTTNPIFMALMFFGVISLGSDLITIPFDIYGTFVIEERFGFNKVTPRIFIMDKLKSWLLTAVMGGLIVSLIVWIYMLDEDLFWVYAWGVITVFSLFMSMFYTSLILPMFNKQKPLNEGSLREKLEALGVKTGFKLDNIFIMDGSKRSTKANAFFSGLGPRKRIILYDTLIQDLTEDEVTAVLAHEIGHYKKKHTLQSLILSFVTSGLMLYILSLFLKSSGLSQALGVEEPNFHVNVLAFGLLYSPVSFIISMFTHMLSRKNEYEADKFAAQHFGAQALIDGLKKLSVKSLSNLLPHKLYVFFNYSHPTLLQRIHALNKPN